MVDEQNKKEQPNLLTKQCGAGAKSFLEVKNCSFSFLAVNSFHVRSSLLLYLLKEELDGGATWGRGGGGVY